MKCLNRVFFALIINLLSFKCVRCGHTIHKEFCKNIDTPAINKLHLTHLFLAKTEKVPTYSLCQASSVFAMKEGIDVKISLTSLI